MNRLMKKALIILCLLALSLLLVWFLGFENNSVTVTGLELKFDKLPPSFDGYKVLQISDLHGKSFGPKQEKLVKLIRECNPDVIVITGDLVDRYDYYDRASLELVRQTVRIAPVYFVTGNHEWLSGKYAELEPKLVSAGAKVLRDSGASLRRGGESISIVGIDDFTYKQYADSKEKIVSDSLRRALKEVPGDEFTILLAHRPELISIYEEFGVDMALSGHAHGGQVRIPFVGAIFAPDQSYPPKYTEGSIRVGNTVLVVSRGLGNSLIPQRIFNRPELVLVTLRN